MEVQKAESLEPTKLACLVYGAPGTGKTYSLRTLPKPVFVFSSDPDGMMTLRGLPQIDFVEVLETKTRGAVATLEEAVEKFESEMLDKYAAVAFDSLSSLSEIVMNYCIKLTGRDPLDLFPSPRKDDKKQGVLLGPNQQDYGNEMTLLMRLINHAIRWPIHKVFIAHSEIVKDQLTGRLFGGPLVTGRLRSRLPNLFSEVYYAHREANKYLWRTKPDSIYIAKSRLASGGHINELEDPNFTAIMGKIEANK